jgi:cell division protein FtsB
MPKKVEVTNSTSPNKSYDNAYLEIWKVEQEHTRTRWTVTTFFLSVSFAIFGFSFQLQDGANPNIAHVQRIGGVALYWFAYLLFLQFNKYNNFLRAQLLKMEAEKQVTFSLETDAKHFMRSRFGKYFTATRLLFYFGVLFTAAVVLLIFFPIV